MIELLTSKLNELRRSKIVYKWAKGREDIIGEDIIGEDSLNKGWEK